MGADFEAARSGARRIPECVALAQGGDGPAGGAARRRSRQGMAPLGAALRRRTQNPVQPDRPRRPRKLTRSQEETIMPDNPRWKRRPAGSTWGDWGSDDQLGRLNLLTPDKVLK